MTGTIELLLRSVVLERAQVCHLLNRFALLSEGNNCQLSLVFDTSLVRCKHEHNDKIERPIIMS
jgi:hypothetical protein